MYTEFESDIARRVKSNIPADIEHFWRLYLKTTLNVDVIDIPYSRMKNENPNSV